MRNVATVSISLLLVLLKLTALYSTAQAGIRNDGVFRKDFARLILTRRFKKDHLHNDLCFATDALTTDVERALHPLSCRGGYKDDGVALVRENGTEISTIDGKHHRLDEVAKAKVYGKFEFSLFQKGDGSDEDPDGIPTRYLKMQLHRRELAKKAVRETLRWREEHRIDTILKRPHPDFDVAKAVFPHYFVTRDVGGHVVFVQRPALLDLKLADKNGLNNKALLGTCVSMFVS